MATVVRQYAECVRPSSRTLRVSCVVDGEPIVAGRWLARPAPAGPRQSVGRVPRCQKQSRATSVLPSVAALTWPAPASPFHLPYGHLLTSIMTPPYVSVRTACISLGSGSGGGVFSFSTTADFDGVVVR